MISSPSFYSSSVCAVTMTYMYEILTLQMTYMNVILGEGVAEPA